MLQTDYYQKEDSHIILQPMGAKGRKSRQDLRVQYDVLRRKFQPSENPLYDREDLNFINEHIQRFHLNDPQYCTGQLMAFVRQVVDQQGKVPKYEYNNLVVELFAEKLSGKTEEEVLKICQAIYIIGFPSI